MGKLNQFHGKTNFLIKKQYKRLVLLFFLSLPLILHAQNLVVKGRIVDSNSKDPLIGAVIKELSSSTNGTSTDLDGRFSITVLPDAVLEISYMGYLSQQVKVGGKSDIEIFLKEDNKLLDEVVVVGYGTQRKSDLTGAITSVKAVELTKISGGNATEALQGKSGVHILNVGSPGSAPVVRVRGVGTNGNPNPLYVVDGMFVDDIQYLNQHDIESMEVLKDASATAIYGSRGANGVILVTTKQGKTGKTVINYTGSEGFQFLSRKYDVCDASQYAQLQNIVADGLGIARDPKYDNPSSFGNGTDWIDETTRNGWIRDHQISASGGSESITYNASVGWFDQQGVLEYTNYQRFTARLNNTYKLHDRVKLGHNITFTNSKNTPLGTMAAMRTMNSIYSISPLITPLNEAGTVNPINPAQDTEIINPYAALYYSKDAKYKSTRFVGNIFGDVKISDGLVFRSSFGFDYNDVKDKIFEDSYMNPGSTHQQHSTNSLQYNYNTFFTWLWENTVTYDKVFGEHKLNLLGGITAQETSAKYLTLTGTGLLFNSPNYLQPQAIPTGNVSLGGNYPYESSIMSYLFRVNYSFKDRYLFTGSFRADGSSKFHKDNRWGYFPSVALGWRVSEEDFMKDVNWIDNLKLRASWGQIGNDKIDNYLFYPVASQDAAWPGVYNALYNGTYYPYYAITNEFNKGIKWERTDQWDVGFNFGTLNNRLNIEFDYFNRDTKDLLYAPAHPGGSTGLAPAMRNIGKINNKGFEFAVEWNDKINDFNYGVRFTGSHFKNEVVDFNKQIFSGGEWMSSASTRGQEGYPLWYFYGYKTDGIYQTQADLDKWNAYAAEHGKSQYHANAKVGDLIYVDTNGDGNITGDDQTKIGSPYPDFTGSLLLTADYKGFDLTIDLTGVFGVDIYNNARTKFSASNFNMHTDWLNAWTPANTDTDMPRLDPSSISFNRNVSFNVQKGDYVKVRNIELGYSLPKTILAKLRAQKMRVYLNATNPLYFTGYKGFNPEVSSGIDFSTYPVSGSARIGVNLTF